jgi:energy-coupling factor transporter ATP-binding protein EcfA2
VPEALVHYSNVAKGEAMENADREQIIQQIAPRVAKGEISLLIGAGFSKVNSSALGPIPDGLMLRDMILEKCKRKPGKSTTLKDAYLMGQGNISDFHEFLASCFTATSVFPWQEMLFRYAWNRIYTTNIDNVLRLAHDRANYKGKINGGYTFFNYLDPNIISDAIGTIPVVTIHGTCEKLEDGFIFSSLEYAKAGLKILDWHRDLAAKIMTGGLVVIGNQMDEADIDTYLVQREAAYGKSGPVANWIVMPNPDEIKADNYRTAGYYVINATAEQFFEELYKAVAPKSIGEIVLENVPTVKDAASKVKAMTWFKGAFRPAFSEIEKAVEEKGIIRHFLTGADPDWFYIINDAYATTSRCTKLTGLIGETIQNNETGFAALHVIGPSGSGKTTAIRSAIRALIQTHQYIYEFQSEAEVDSYLLRDLITGFTGKSVFVFYSAAAYYFAVNVIGERLRDRGLPFCLFILEDRLSDYNRNIRQLDESIKTIVFEMGDLDVNDARVIALKLEQQGITIENFSEKSLDRRAHIIQDKERGFGGDLLSALFSLTTHENFERKIYTEYQDITDQLSRNILEVVAIVNSFGYTLPLEYIAGFLNESVERVTKLLREDLDGVLLFPRDSGSVKCRHRIIANYYFTNCISGYGQVDLIVGVLEFLSRKFSVEDIKHHPLPYKIYKELIAVEFLYNKYFPPQSRKEDSLSTYHSAQKFFNKDGIFWLHFGRYYKKINETDLAIDCFRTGLEFYNSFQTVHSLGMILLEKFVATGGHDLALYNEGVSLLESERIRRGTSDPYPTTGLIEALLKVKRLPNVPPGCEDLLRVCINNGLRYFKEDEYFARVFGMYMATQTS